MNPRALFPHVDHVVLLLVFALASIGFIMMSSASMDYAALKHGNAFFYSIRQMFFIVLASIIAMVAFSVPTKWWNQYDWVCLLAAIVLLVLVLIPGVGREVNGSMRWIPIGPINLQSSEPAKVLMLIYMAGYLVRRQDEVREKWSGFLKPAGVIFIITVLLIKEPDFGATVVLLFSCVGMIFLAGLGIKQVIVLVSSALLGIGVMALGSAYRLQRLSCFADPWAYAYDCGYQLTQALIAFGRGEFFGLGLGNSIQKLFYLPEAHTDFVFAILAEELGFVGSVLVVLLFAGLIYRILLIAQRAEENQLFFSAYLSYGIALLFSAQVFINIGVNSGLLPTKGLTLPLLSYGGSSLMAVAMMLGILLRIDAEMRISSAQSSAENLRGRRLA